MISIRAYNHYQLGQSLQLVSTKAYYQYQKKTTTNTKFGRGANRGAVGTHVGYCLALHAAGGRDIRVGARDDVHPRNPRPEIHNPETEIRDPKTEIRNPKFETRNLEPGSQNPEPETRRVDPGGEVMGAMSTRAIETISRLYHHPKPET